MRLCLLSGGFGGARFARALVAAFPGSVEVVTNPGDDLEYLDGSVWPDFDSVLYSLAGVFDEAQGWGIIGDVYDAPGWFRIGKRDLALSRERAGWLAAGASRGEAARRASAAMGVSTPLWPASGEDLRTSIMTASGAFPFQDYLVRQAAAQAPTGIELTPSRAAACDEAVEAIAVADLVMMGPSNPISSLYPIVAVPRIGTAVRSAGKVIAVSPVVTAVAPVTAPECSRYKFREQLMTLFNLEHSARGVSELWAGLIDGLVVDYRDDYTPSSDLPVLATDLLTRVESERVKVAHDIVQFGLSVATSSGTRDPAHKLMRETLNDD